MRYPIVIHKEEGSCYGVSVPDLPGCTTAADTLDEALEEAREAIAFHVEGLLLLGEPVPRTAPLETHLANGNFADGMFAVVSVDVAKLKSKATRINISLPARVLAIIDEAAAREGESRSGLIARAALAYVERRARA